jgi:hypothetical protein
MTAAQNKKIKDVSINDIEESVVETVTEVKSEAVEKLEDLQERAETLRDETVQKVNGFSPTQKTLLLTGGVLFVSTLVQAAFTHFFRKPVVNQTILIESPDEFAEAETIDAEGV